LIIGFSQLKHLLGINIPRSNHIHEIIGNAFSNASWHEEGVKIVGDVPKGLPAFSIPNLNFENVKALLPIAITISFISFMQSISIAKSIQIKNNADKKSNNSYQIIPNQELIALGIMNIGGSFFQSLPTTGGFARTAVNVQNGAKTGVAPIISAGVIALTLLFLTPLFYYLPNAILASIIMVAVLGLIDFKEAKHLWKTDKGDFLMMLATFLGTLSLGIEEGILIGVLLSLSLIIFRTTQPHSAVLGKISEEPYYKNIDRFKDLEVRDDILILRFDARLYFANVNFFKEKIENEILAKGENLKLFILDADSMNGMDSSGVHAIKEMIEFCEDRKVQFQLVGVKGPIRDILHRAGVVEKIGEANFFFRIQHAVDFFDKKTTRRYHEYALQTNEGKQKK